MSLIDFQSKREIELLSPAKTADIGIEAINHGADAVYIGAPHFSARAAAGNSIADITRLINYAHRFRAKVYIALNTILTNAELQLAESIIWQLYEAGADALIVQDMGLLELSLPPIALHASTQTDNRSLDKIKFLENTGFSQIVLARELSLEQIKLITSQTSAKIECFVHGALCVSYSGQCYASQALRGRSANRGECAQLCRLPYQLEDGNGKILSSQKHFLSLKDLNLSAYLAEMMDVGVSSFKIEGRLKEMSYVKNITAFYRKKLDQLLMRSDRYVKSSLGNVKFSFDPDPERTFYRGATDYFLHQRKTQMVQLQTPKSIGQQLGTVRKQGKGTLTVNTKYDLHNGDGLCFVSSDGTLTGFRVNRIENDLIFPFKMPDIKPGTTLYRNFDQAFEDQLAKPSAERKIPLRLSFSDTEDGFNINANIDRMEPFAFHFSYDKELSKNGIEITQQNIIKQLGKLGDSVFTLEKIDITLSNAWFIPSSVLTVWRRTMVEQLEQTIHHLLKPDNTKKNNNLHPALFPQSRLTYLGNVANDKARTFYLSHGVTSIEPALESGGTLSSDSPVMTTKYCLKYEMGWCPRQQPDTIPQEPLFLQGAHDRLQLHFNCAACEMQIIIANKKQNCKPRN
ncbi:peptidase U32 family protein [Microbacter margulisiae]|uniref:Putative protease n=1 Tax=Microbacter margulisiae TaxID=1350067 RepID=A0A7W5DS41_9PORP|nr:U32 family peptidase [Microbacter margulisiae]MBB3188039.1 putative protease [Microbacter margulisiae]